MKKYLKILTFVTIFLFFTVNIFAAQENVVSIGENTYNSLSEAVKKATDGATIEVLGDVVESSTIVIDKGITINANGKKIEFTSLTSTSNAGFLIQTAKQVNFNNMNLVTNKRGIAISAQEHNLNVKDSNITVEQRGISVNTDNNTNSNLNVENTTIQLKGISNYDENVAVPDSRGISLWQYTNSSITIKNSTIQGFYYDINIASEGYNFENTNILVENCRLKGRAGLNVWSTVKNLNIKNSYILGINNETGVSEGFANIVLYNDGSVVNVENTEFINYENSIGLANENAVQYMFNIRGNDNVINLSGNTTFTDTTNKINDNFWIYENNSKINIYSGKYTYPVDKYLDTGYTTIKEDGKYVVGLKATDLQIEENIDLTLEDSYSLETSVTPQNTIDVITYTSMNEDIVTVDQDGKILTKNIGKTQIKVTIGSIEKVCNVNVFPKQVIEESNTQNKVENLDISLSENTSEILQDSLVSNTELYAKVREELLSGKKVTTELSVEKISDDKVEEIKDKIKSKIDEKFVISELLDINVFVKSNDTNLGSLTNLSNEIEFSVKIPDELLKENREFGMVRIHDDQVEVLETEFENGFLKVKTDKFSVYALVYTETSGVGDAIREPVMDNTNNNQSTPDAPQTGDIVLLAAISIITISIAVVVVLQMKKKQLNNIK